MIDLFRWLCSANSGMSTSDCAAALSAISAAISTMFGLLSLGFALYVYRKTLPTERPIIALKEKTVSEQMGDDNRLLRADINLTFCNMGKHPASKIFVRADSCPADAPQRLRSFVSVTLANTIQPETTLHWLATIDFEKVNSVLRDQLDHFLYFRITYGDAWAPRRKGFADEFYLFDSARFGMLVDATLDQRQMIEEQVSNALGK